MSGVRRTLFAVAACSCLSLAPTANAFMPGSAEGQGYNILEHAPRSLPAAMSKDRQHAFEALRQDLNGAALKLEWQRNGSFAFLRNAEVGNPLIPGFASPEPGAAESAARRFLERYRGMFGLTANQLGTLEVDRNRLIGETRYSKGIYYVSFVQRVQGIRVDQARVTFALHPDTGDLYAVTSNVFGAPDDRSAAEFRLSPKQGVRQALAAVGVTGTPGSMRVNNGRYVVQVRSSQLDGPVSLRKVFLHAAPGRLVPGYVAEVWTRQHGLLRVGIDARNGDHLHTIPQTSNYSYQMSGWSTYPLDEDGSIVSPSLLSVSPDTTASPSGWLSPMGSDGKYRTIGPNVVTFYDWSGQFSGFEYESAMSDYTAVSTSISGAGSSSEVVAFDYNSQWNDRSDPKNYVQLSILENFRRMNELHDHYYNLGFTPEEGNFQDDDPVLVNAQDSYDLGTYNNANFSTPDDGESGRMNMYVFNADGTDELRDGSMDREVFAHELGHGLSHRLVNFGDNSLYGAQSGAFGEGQADVFAFMREPVASSDPELWALAPYLAWKYFMYVQRTPVTYLATGPFANEFDHPMGRFTAYTYNIGDEYKITDENAQRTLEHFGLLPIAIIGDGAYGNAVIGFRGNYTYYLYPEVHSDGEIWAAAMWRTKVRANDHDWSVSTDDRMLGLEQTFLMGMQLMPANPNFIQSRDAIIIYEEMTQTEPVTCMLKYEFARTGMGKYATAGEDGSYGADTDYDETTSSFPEIVTDFAPWGCAPGTYTTTSGDVTMLFTSPASEVETNVATSVHLVATTPGYNTKATVSGPYIGTLSYTSTTDYIDKTIGYTPTADGTNTFTATVTSSKGESKSVTLDVKSVTPVVLAASGDSDASYVDLNSSAHYKIFLDSSAYSTGHGISVALASTDDVDIDLYFNIDQLALPDTAMGYDADEDGDESLKVEKTDEGWQVINASGTTWDLDPAGEDFWFYADAYGFTASNYTMTVTPY